MVVLDITAGNRHIWGGWMPEIPEEGPVIHSDIEPRLKKRPDVICDLKHLPYRDGVAHAVILDAPYWNFGTSIHGDPKEAVASFWGNFKNLAILRRLLVGGMKSSRRVLRRGCRLYLKWCDVVYPWTRFETIFTRDFRECHRMERQSHSGRGKKPCYWITYELHNIY